MSRIRTEIHGVWFQDFLLSKKMVSMHFIKRFIAYICRNMNLTGGCPDGIRRSLVDKYAYEDIVCWCGDRTAKALMGIAQVQDSVYCVRWQNKLIECFR